MTQEIPDPRSEADLIADYSDIRLIDFYHQAGLLESKKDAVYDHGKVLDLVRAAYWLGTRDKEHDPGGIAKTKAEYTAAEQRRRENGSTI